MTIQEQKVLLKLLTREQIAELYPPVVSEVFRDLVLFKNTGACASSARLSQKDAGWWCTRAADHTGPHIRHKIGLKARHPSLPYVWLNKEEK